MKKKTQVSISQVMSGKAYTTIKKQDSLWENHLKEKFGNRFIDEISVAEVNDYLETLYYKGRAYKYVEGFLKMFYLIFGQAYSRNYLDIDTYNKLCVTKEGRIKMPKMKTDEDLDIVRQKYKNIRQYVIIYVLLTDTRNGEEVFAWKL